MSQVIPKGESGGDDRLNNLGVASRGHVFGFKALSTVDNVEVHLNDSISIQYTHSVKHKQPEP